MSKHETNTDTEDGWGPIPQEQLERARARMETNQSKANGPEVGSIRNVKEPTNRDRAVVLRRDSNRKKKKHLDCEGAPACGLFPAEECRSISRDKIETLSWCSHCATRVEADE